MATNGDATGNAPAGLLRRFAALFYDGLLLVALWMVAAAAFLPFTDGEAVRWETHPLVRVLLNAVLVGAWVGFYGVFWRRQGQTLGMASWRLRLERLDGRRITWRDTLVRLGAAVLSWLPLGLGWWWCLVDAQRRTWHDTLSGTRVVVVPKADRSTRGAGAN